MKFNFFTILAAIKVSDQAGAVRLTNEGEQQPYPYPYNLSQEAYPSYSPGQQVTWVPVAQNQEEYKKQYEQWQEQMKQWEDYQAHEKCKNGPPKDESPKTIGQMLRAQLDGETHIHVNPPKSMLKKKEEGEKKKEEDKKKAEEEKKKEE